MRIRQEVHTVHIVQCPRVVNHIQRPCARAGIVIIHTHADLGRAHLLPLHADNISASWYSLTAGVVNRQFPLGILICTQRPTLEHQVNRRRRAWSVDRNDLKVLLQFHALAECHHREIEIPISVIRRPGWSIPVLPIHHDLRPPARKVWHLAVLGTELQSASRLHTIRRAHGKAVFPCRVMVSNVLAALPSVVLGIAIPARTAVCAYRSCTRGVDIPVVNVHRQVVGAVRSNDAHRRAVVVRPVFAVREPAIELAVDQHTERAVQIARRA